MVTSEKSDELAHLLMKGMLRFGELTGCPTGYSRTAWFERWLRETGHHQDAVWPIQTTPTTCGASTWP